jgi:hypothetical protein
MLQHIIIFRHGKTGAIKKEEKLKHRSYNKKYRKYIGPHLYACGTWIGPPKLTQEQEKATND